MNKVFKMNERKENVRVKRKTLQAARENARDQLCRPPRYAGKPEDYTYVLQEYCRPKDKHRENPKITSEIVSGPVIPLSQTKKEIVKIQEILGAYEYDRQELPDDPRFMLFILPDIFELMTSVKFRKKYPDPDKRFHFVVSQLQKDVRNSMDDNNSFTSGSISKQIVMRMMLTHLEASQSQRQKD